MSNCQKVMEEKFYKAISESMKKEPHFSSIKEKMKMFLTEQKALLEKYNASISASHVGQDDDDIEIHFSVEENDESLDENMKLELVQFDNIYVF